MTRSASLIPALIFLTLLVASQPIAAQDGARAKAEIANYAKAMSEYCAGGQWLSSWCRGVMGPSNKVLAANYIARLKGAEHEGQAQSVQESCAAASAVAQQEVPRATLVEVYTVCMNAMADAAAATGVRPNQNHYQLLLVAYFCTNQNEKFCAQAESQLAAVP